MGLPAEGKPGADPKCVDANDKADAFDCLSDDIQKPAVNTVLVNWSKAIAAYEYKLVSGDTPFDRFVNEGPASTAISAAAKRGARLFVGKGACIDCHAGPQMTDEQFHDIAVPQVGMRCRRWQTAPRRCLRLRPGHAGRAVVDRLCSVGRLRRPAELAVNNGFGPRSGATTGADTTSRRRPDAGMAPGADLKGAWRTPSLRNVALTAPYMHDGVSRRWKRSSGTTTAAARPPAASGSAPRQPDRAADVRPTPRSPIWSRSSRP